MKVCIVSKIDSKEAVELARSLGWALSDAGYEVVYEDSIASELGYAGVALSKLKADFVFVLGGDGSVLRAVRLMKKQIPVLGINQGDVGFLTDVERENTDQILKGLPSPLKIEPRMRIAIKLNGKDLGSALNEAVVETSRPAKILKFNLFVNGKKIDEFRADGLIVGTPTGSTAYAMSAGGPIVDSTLEAMLLVPIAPYMLSSRPYLINSDSEIEIKLVSNKPALLVIDGQDQFELSENDSLVITKSEEPALFVDVGRSFFEKVEQKLRS